MVKFIAFLIFACFFGVGVFWLSLNSGTLYFTILDYSIETNVAYAAIILLAALLLINFILVFFYRIIALPSLIRDVLVERKRDKKEQLLLELIEAITKEDRTQVSKVFKGLSNLNLPEKVCNQLSVIAHTNNNDQAYKASLLTLLKYPDLKIVSYTRLVDIAVAEQEWLVGCNYCTELWKVKPDENTAKLYIKVFYNAKRFHDCLDFLSQFKMMRLLKKKSRDTLEGLCYFELAERGLKDSGSTDDTESYYEYAIDKLPEFIPALKGLIDQKIYDKQFDDATKILERVWKKLPHFTFTKLLGKLAKHYSEEGFYKIVRKIVSSQPKHYESRLILAESSMANAQFELAAREIAEALSHPIRFRALLLMAKFCLVTHGNAQEALEWLKQASDAETDMVFTQYYVDFDGLNISNIQPKNGLLVASV